MINPAAKLAKLKAREAKQHADREAREQIKRAQKHKRHGKISATEKAIVAELVEVSPTQQLTPVQTASLALALNRKVSTVEQVISDAREQLNTNARKYVQAHEKIIDLALQNDDPKSLEVARRASQWAIEKISAKDANGKSVRVVDVETAENSNSPKIQIGIALGGIPVPAK